jgi:hypothetical protein
MVWIEGAGHRRRRQTVRGLPPRPRRPATFRRHLLLPSRRRTRRPREEAKVRDGAWHDHSLGEVTFAEYVENVWLPSKHLQTSTLAAYRSYLDKHFIPTFGRRPMPTEIQPHRDAG